MEFDGTEYNPEHFKDQFKEVCGNCGLVFGHHHAGITSWPRNYCPDPEARMDWINGPGTIFKETGVYEEDI